MVVVDDFGLMVARLLNPGVIVALVLSGVAYGGFLWSLHIRPNFTLWAVGVFPGALFIVLVGVVRVAVQHSTSTLYPVLFVAWMIFANSGVLAVMVARRWRRRS